MNYIRQRMERVIDRQLSRSTADQITRDVIDAVLKEADELDQENQARWSAKRVDRQPEHVDECT